MLLRTLTHIRHHGVAYLALFVALGGTSFAASQLVLPPNSVGTKQLRDRAITKRKIARTTFAALKGIRGPRGALGPQGLKGPKGPTGEKGPTGSRGQQGPTGMTGSTGTTGATGPAGTARAYALVWSDGNLFAGRSHNVASVDHLTTGEYCVELDPNIVASTTGATVSPWMGTDTTAEGMPGNIAHVEYGGTCGTNGIFVVTFRVDNSVTQANRPFFIVVP